MMLSIAANETIDGTEEMPDKKTLFQALGSE